MPKTTTSKTAGKTMESKTAAPVKRRSPAAKSVAAARKSAALASAKEVKAAEKPVEKPTEKAVEKPAAKPAAKPAVKPEAEQKEKPRKIKLVRDSFTMPEVEYAVLGEVKKACLKAGIEVKKSELLRVGVALIRQLDTAKLKEVLDSLPALKAGRPKKGK